MGRPAGLLLALALLVSGCTGPTPPEDGAVAADDIEPSAGPGAGASPDATTRVDADLERRLRRLLTVPPLPSFTVPTGLLSTSRGTEIADDLGVPPGLYDGIAVVDARCTDAGDVAADAGLATPAAQHYEDEAVSITVAGDGTGVYDAPGRHVAVLPGGAGVYEDDSTRLSVAVDGSGTYRRGDRRYTVRADGSGSYTDEATRVWIDADGAGGYEDDDVRVSLSAHGEVFGDADAGELAAVRAVLGDGLPPFPPVPRIVGVEPAGDVCGTVIRLDANVAFDFGSAQVRPEGQSLIDRVAGLLLALGGPRARVDGHTDAIGEADDNVDLSDRRATAVRDRLVAAGVAVGTLSTRGLGESRPLRPETGPDGADDPAARQLDRRVEIVLLDG